MLSEEHVLLMGLCRFCVETTMKKRKKRENWDGTHSPGLVVPLVKTLMLPKIFAKMQVHLKLDAFFYTYKTFVCLSFLWHINDT